jgi:hypothetical protein
LKHRAVLIDTGMHSSEHPPALKRPPDDPVLYERNAVVRRQLPISSCVGSSENDRQQAGGWYPVKKVFPHWYEW